MADKMTWIELRRAIVARTGASQKEVNIFLDELINQIIVALKRDKLVRISGLGTFKLLSVSPRKGVNVATGEDIVIQGYDKVTFTPEAGVKELFADLREMPKQKEDQTITPLQKLGAQADEIVGILADLGQAPKTAEPVVEPAPVVVEPAVVEPAVAAPVVEPKTVEPVVEPEPKKEEPAKEDTSFKRHFLRDTLITLLILLVILACAFFFLRHQLTKWIDSLAERMNTPIEQVQTPAADTVQAIVLPAVDTIMVQDTVVDADTAVVETTETVPETAVVEPAAVVNEEPAVETKPAEQPQYKEGDVIASTRLKRGDDLSKIALKYYGHRDLWVYIFEYNKAKLGDPDNIPIGIRIKIPYLTDAQRDVNNPETKAKIHEFYELYVRNKK